MKKLINAIILVCLVNTVLSQDHNEANYDEAKVPAYTLPDPLKTANNIEVKDKANWEKARRSEILKLFEDNIYGQMPKTYSSIKYSVTKEDTAAMNGKAKLKHVLIDVVNNNKSVKINLLLFVPNAAKKPVPAFLLINNRGKDNTDPTRVTKSEFWPAEMLIDSGLQPLLLTLILTSSDFENISVIILRSSFNYLSLQIMRIVLILVYTFATAISFGQNPDIPDYRSKKEVFSRITEKDIRSDIASFSMGGIDESIGKLPLKSLPITELAGDHITFASDNIIVKISSVPFDKTKHKLGFFEEKYLVKIDNKPYFGDYGKVPKTAIGNVTVIIDRDTVAIPPAAYSDLYNPVFSFYDKGVQKSQDKVYLSNDGHKVYVYMLKQESGGSYEVTWVIQDKKYIRRVVDFGFLK